MNQKFIVKQKPGLSVWWWLVIALIAIAIGSLVGFRYGQSRAGFDRSEFLRQVNNLENTVDAIKIERLALERQLAELRTSKQVDDGAYQLIDDSLESLNEQLREQREQLAFYERIVTPEAKGKDVRVHRFRIDETEDAQRFKATIVLVRDGRRDRRVNGALAIVVKGLQDGVEADLDWNSLLIEDQVGANMKFAFRYFQDFKQELELPVGFTPQSVEITVKPAGSGYTPLEQIFAWMGPEEATDS